MTDIERYKARLNEIVSNNNDLEMDHVAADEILCELLIELGYTEIVKLFNTIEKWYA